MAAESPQNSVPRHIGFILDGNRRWAKDHKLPTLEGHRRGYESLKKITEACFDRGVEYVSAYIFSTENWQRSKDEVSFLMDFAYQMSVKDLAELNERGIRLVWLGSRDNVDDKLRRAIENAVEQTKDNSRGTLCVCFNYGGRQEIVEAIRSMLKEKIDPQSVSPELVQQYLYAPQVPDPDLIVRTSGEQRTSNFLLWEAAYAELYFEPAYWPDFDEHKLDNVLEHYHNRSRRFGK